MNKIILEILLSSPNKREEIFKSIENLVFDGDEKVIVDVLSSLDRDFQIEDYCRKFFEIGRGDLFIECLEEQNNEENKRYVEDLKKKKLQKYVKCFDRFIK